MVRRSASGSVLRVATGASRLRALRWAAVLAGLALGFGIAFFKTLSVALPVGAFVLVATLWWIFWMGRPVLEFTPSGIVVRNLVRTWRIRWADVNWIGEGWTIDRRGGGWAVTIYSKSPIAGVPGRDVPMEEKLRRRQGELPRHVIGCRATRPAGRRPREIVDAVREVAREHEVPVRFAVPAPDQATPYRQMTPTPVQPGGRGDRDPAARGPRHAASGR